MQKKFLGKMTAGVVGVAVVGGLSFGAVAPANAAEAPNPCDSFRAGLNSGQNFEPGHERVDALESMSPEETAPQSAQLQAIPNNIPKGLMFGIDTNSGQGYNVDFPVLKKAGGKFVFIKQGGGNPDSDKESPYVAPRYAGQLKAARAAGLPVAHYFVNGLCNYSVDGHRGTVEQAAQKFAETADVKKGDIVALAVGAVDGEPAFTPEQILAWITTVQEKFNGVQVLVNMNFDTLESRDWSKVSNAGNPLWLGFWGANDGTIQDVAALRTRLTTDKAHGVGGWTDFAATQFTSKGSYPGYSGPLDGNLAKTDIFNNYGWKGPMR